jgi:hypothetical protein
VTNQHVKVNVTGRSDRFRLAEEFTVALEVSKYCLAKITRDHYYFPRFELEHVQASFGGNVHYAPSPTFTPSPIATTAAFELDELHTRIVDSAMPRYSPEAYAECRATCVINLERHISKTLIAFEIFRRLCARGVAHRMLIITSHPRHVLRIHVQIARYMANLPLLAEYQAARICVTTIEDDKTTHGTNDYSFIVYDGAHAASNMYCHAMFWKRSWAALALADDASKGTLGYDRCLYAHFGPPITFANYDPRAGPLAHVQAHHYTMLHVEKFPPPINIGHTWDINFHETYRKYFVTNSPRNGAIGYLSGRLRSPHIILTALDEHVTELQQECISAHYEDEVPMLISTDPADPADILITTYATLFTHRPGLTSSAVILAMPILDISYGDFREYFATQTIHFIIDEIYPCARREVQREFDYFGLGPLPSKSECDTFNAAHGPVESRVFDGADD